MTLLSLDLVVNWPVFFIHLTYVLPRIATAVVSVRSSVCLFHSCTESKLLSISDGLSGVIDVNVGLTSMTRTSVRFLSYES